MFYRHSNTFRKFELTPKGLIVIWISMCTRAHVHTMHIESLQWRGKKKKPKTLVLNYRSLLPFFLTTKSLAARNRVTSSDLVIKLPLVLEAAMLSYKQLSVQWHSDYKLTQKKSKSEGQFWKQTKKEAWLVLICLRESLLSYIICFMLLARCQNLDVLTLIFILLLWNQKHPCHFHSWNT